MPRGKLGYLIAANAMAYQGRKLYGHARWAYRTARGMYYGRSRKRTLRRARKYRRRYRKIRQGKRQRFGRSTFGFTPGSSMSRRTLTSFDYVWQNNTRTLVRFNVTNITKGSDIDNREADLIYFAGCKYRFHVKNPRQDPLVLHIAICAPREFAGAGGQAAAEQNFFRDVNGTRGLNFSTNMNSLEMNSRGINSDLYHIFSHKRYYFGPDASGTPQSEGYEAYTQKNWKYLSKWVPVKRQIRYEDGTAGSCVNKVFMFVWSDLHNAESTQTPQTGVDGMFEVVSYWRNSREN